MRCRGLFAFGARVGISASLIAACDGALVTPEDAGDVPDAANDRGTVQPIPGQPTTDAVSPQDVSTPNDAGIRDARSDVYDAPPVTRACSSVAPTVCNFEPPNAGGVCPPFAGIFVSGTGQPKYQPGRGPDGSTALAALVPAGGAAGIAMPFYTFEDGPIPTFPGCRATCEANIRFSEGDAGVAIVVGDDSTWLLAADGGTFVHSSARGAQANAPVTNEWMKVSVLLTPVGDAATSQLTLTVNDASTTSTISVPKVGTNMRFGAVVPFSGVTTPVAVYVDNIVCQFHD